MSIILTKNNLSGSGLLAARIGRALRRAYAAYCQRCEEQQAAADLRAMDDYTLRDLGITRCEIDERVRFPARR
jgi:uncharacterized protein YjiS (DUF1127 family)